jgi:protein TonB
MASYAYDQGRNPRRTAVLIGILIFHVIVIYAFANGLAQSLVAFVAPPLDTTLVEEKKVKEEPPPPPPPELERPPVQIVAPEINISLTPDTPPPPIQQVTTQAVITPPAPPRPPAASTALGRVSGPSTEDYYPSSAKSAEQEGRPVIKVCVAVNGKLDSAEVATTSGFPLLDEAAVRLAKASRWKAATQEGKPVSTCGNLPIRFELKKTKG